MDRIREAVLKARQSQSGAGDAGATKPAPDNAQARTQDPARAPDGDHAQPARKKTPTGLAGTRFSQSQLNDAASPELDRFRRVACDFSGFTANRIISNEQDPVLNAYRVMRTRVLQKMQDNNWRTIAVVSPGAAAGKTVTAVNLAISIGSKDGNRVTLVDLDFYRPRIAKYLGISDPPSVVDYFEGKKSLEAVTVRPDLTDMLLIANERVSRRGGELLASNKSDELVQTAIQDFGSRVVIFDMSPLLGCDDTIAFLPKVDCALVVASSGETRSRDLKEAIRVLGDTPIIGSVLNKAPTTLSPNPYY